MWVWPQVSLGRPSPSTPYDLGPPPPTSLGRTLPEHCKNSQGVGGKREGEGGEGRAVVREGSSSCNGGGTLQTAVGARPTSGGSRKNLRKCAFRVRLLPFAVSRLARPDYQEGKRHINLRTRRDIGRVSRRVLGGTDRVLRPVSLRDFFFFSL